MFTKILFIFICGMENQIAYYQLIFNTRIFLYFNYVLCHFVTLTVLKGKFKRRWSTIQPVSLKQKMTIHLYSRNTKRKQHTTLEITIARAQRQTCRSTQTHYLDSEPAMSLLLLLNAACNISREATNKNFIVFDFT